MVYEPGSAECRLLIDAKNNIEQALRSLNGLENIDQIKRELVSIYNQLESMHELKRAKDLKNL